MAPDSGMAFAILLFCIVLPGLAFVLLQLVSLWAVSRRRIVLAVGSELLATAVALIWFFSFGIEYMPRHSGKTIVVPDSMSGAVLVQVCPNQGAPVDTHIHIENDGVARVRADWFQSGVDLRDWSDFTLQQGGDTRSILANGTAITPDCAYLEFWLGSPADRPIAAVDYDELLDEMAKDRVSFNEVMHRHAL